MEVTQFYRTKHGRELLIDTRLISEQPNFILNNKAFVVDFYEIFFVIKGECLFTLHPVLNQADI